MDDAEHTKKSGTDEVPLIYSIQRGNPCHTYHPETHKTRSVAQIHFWQTVNP